MNRIELIEAISTAIVRESEEGMRSHEAIMTLAAMIDATVKASDGDSFITSRLFAGLSDYYFAQVSEPWTALRTGPVLEVHDTP